MAVQNPFFGGRRDNDNSGSKFLGGSSSSSSGSTLPTTAAGSASSVLGGNLASKTEESASPIPSTNYTSTVTTDNTAGTTGSKLTVGPNIKLKGVEITDCDTLVVEGTVEATMDSRVIQIAEQGAFKGSANIDIAEIRGTFDGELTVRDKLVIFATGKVTGKVRYGKIVIEEGGQVSGEISSDTSAKLSSSKPADKPAEKTDSAAALAS